MALILKVITPEGEILTKEVSEVVVPTDLGETGILPGHQPLASTVVPGVLQFIQGGKRESIAVASGFLHVQLDHVYVMVEQAVNVVEIDSKEAEDARQRAEKALQEARSRQADREEIRELEAKIKYQVVKQFARKMDIR